MPPPIAATPLRAKGAAAAKSMRVRAMAWNSSAGNNTK